MRLSRIHFFDELMHAPERRHGAFGHIEPAERGRDIDLSGTENRSLGERGGVDAAADMIRVQAYEQRRELELTSLIARRYWSD